jgi:hypothetical protein
MVPIIFVNTAKKRLGNASNEDFTKTGRVTKKGHLNGLPISF